MTSGNQPSETVHPLFDDCGYYRLATQTSVWHDGGRQSVVDFFASRARAQARQDLPKDQPLPPAADLWGFGPRIDATLHEFQKRNEQSAELEAEALLARAGGVRLLARLPSEEAAKTQVPSSSQRRSMAKAPERGGRVLIVGGESAESAGPLRKLASVVKRPAPGSRDTQFEMDLADLPPSRRFLVLFLSDDLIRRLHRHLQSAAPDPESLPEPGDTIGEQEASEVIRTALRPEVLSPAIEDSPARRKAFRLAQVLSMAPALETVTTKNGRLTALLDLGRECPALDDSSWLVLCAGPHAEVEKPAVASSDEGQTEEEESEVTPQSLLERLRAGDAGAWKEFSEIYTPLLRTWFSQRHRFLSHAVSTEDLMQTVRVKVFEQLPAFQDTGPPGAFRRWLNKIVRRSWHEFALRHRSRAISDSDLARDLDELEDPHGESQLAWDREHDVHVLSQMLAMAREHFPQRLWAMFQRTVMEGKTAWEVAAELNVSVVAVARARVSVFRLLREKAKNIVDPESNVEEIVRKQYGRP